MYMLMRKLLSISMSDKDAMRIITAALASVCTMIVLTACDKETQSNVQAPGSAESVKTKALETGAAILQNKPPIEAINAYLDGFHFYNGRQQTQMEAHHFCSILNEDVIQCVIYDGNVKDAKMMGVEYIVSESREGALAQPRARSQIRTTDRAWNT
jgi:hypothetical protein